MRAPLHPPLRLVAGRGPAAVLLLALLLLGALAGPAAAHAELSGSVPQDVSVLASVPAVVELSFTEQPVDRSTVTVLDGCGAQVGGEVQVVDRALRVPVTGGAPGPWSVRYAVVSTTDGHPSEGSTSFTVSGQADCSSAPAVPAPAAAGGEEERRSGTTWLVLAGGAALLGTAVVVRRATR